MYICIDTNMEVCKWSSRKWWIWRDLVHHGQYEPVLFFIFMRVLAPFLVLLWVAACHSLLPASPHLLFGSHSYGFCFAVNGCQRMLWSVVGEESTTSDLNRSWKFIFDVLEPEETRSKIGTFWHWSKTSSAMSTRHDSSFKSQEGFGKPILTSVFLHRCFVCLLSRDSGCQSWTNRPPGHNIRQWTTPPTGFSPTRAPHSSADVPGPMKQHWSTAWHAWHEPTIRSTLMNHPNTISELHLKIIYSIFLSCHLLSSIFLQVSEHNKILSLLF